LGVGALLVGCGDDGGSGGAGGSGQGGVLTPIGGSGSVNDAIVCSNACADIVPLMCESGPPNQAECENGCRTIRSACREQHDVLLECAGPEPEYACSENGAVVVVACMEENVELNQCIVDM
jgi:hypothetical protein